MGVTEWPESMGVAIAGMFAAGLTVAWGSLAANHRGRWPGPVPWRSPRACGTARSTGCRKKVGLE